MSPEWVSQLPTVYGPAPHSGCAFLTYALLKFSTVAALGCRKVVKRLDQEGYTPLKVITACLAFTPFSTEVIWS